MSDTATNTPEPTVSISMDDFDKLRDLAGLQGTFNAIQGLLSRITMYNAYGHLEQSREWEKTFRAMQAEVDEQIRVIRRAAQLSMIEPA